MVSLDAFFGDYKIEAEGRGCGDVRLDGSTVPTAPLTVDLTSSAVTEAALKHIGT
jgi:hypothetical protein